jgi:hypothetical protein
MGTGSGLAKNVIPEGLTMGTLNSREYRALKGRKFQPYPEGHRRMYEIPIELMRGNQYRIYEAGFGIGWGLDQMVAANIIEHYVGCEPDQESYEYVHKRHGHRENVTLVRASFVPPELPPFDFSFCIEVIEHVPMQEHASFLEGLRRLGPRLWFSTPDIERHAEEGVRTTAEWMSLLRRAGFEVVSVNTDHWTYLYECR